MVEVRHGEYCDADLRHNGCVCTDDPKITVEEFLEQARREYDEELRARTELAVRRAFAE
ncbi:MAG: hypothetical protein ACR2JV_06290 [Gaiellales bacterium]